ncbi:MAG: hypothetical protein KBD04_03060 [Proteobacteria bacterium]|nr:hypothetical protein [Pseudomonadota bacterium]
MIQEFHHPDTIVELTIRKNNNSKMASIQVRRNLEDQTFNLNESYDVQDENQAKAIASKIANYFGTNKLFIVEPCVNIDAQQADTTSIYAEDYIPPFFVFFDTCALQKEGFMEKVNKLRDEGKILPLIPNSVKEEIHKEGSKTPGFVRELFNSVLHTQPVELTSDEQDQRILLKQQSRGNSLPKNIDPDLEHVSEAIKYRAKYFVTCDKPLIRKQHLINKQFHQIHLLTPEEFLSLFETQQ